MASSILTKLELSAQERKCLEGYQRRRRTANGLATRSRIVLLAAEGLTNKAIATKVGVSRGTVSKWRSRFIERSIDGLHDEPRPGAPRKISDAMVERVVVETLESSNRSDPHLKERRCCAMRGG